MMRALVVATALATTLALAGCSDDSGDGARAGDPASSSSATPSDSTRPAETPTATSSVPDSFGSTVNGTGYTFEVPEGWGQPEQRPPGIEMDAFAVSLQDADGFTDNVNVILSPAETVTRQLIRAEFAGAGAEVTFGKNVKISGIDSIHVMGQLANRGADYYIEQFYPMAADGQVYVVTFSFSVSVTPEQRTKVIDETLASWTWTI